ncbi:SSI family serine proteinase inhibitor [Nocardia sp. NPDC019395]|uniref:SSI family serine proteinase inhibitor n=1 Tax=Nocardia sp. NPDC019395 TaxID=3154686 RepID=UPI0033E71199
MSKSGRIAAAAVLLCGIWFALAPAQAQEPTTEPAPSTQAPDSSSPRTPSRTNTAPSDTPVPEAGDSRVSVLTLAAVARSGKPEFRTTTLLCAPKEAGTHPEPADACAELEAAGGDFAELTAEPAACPMIYEPVSLVVVGLWDSRPVTYQHDFANWCVMANAAEHVYKF